MGGLGLGGVLREMGRGVVFRGGGERGMEDFCVRMGWDGGIFGMLEGVARSGRDRMVDALIVMAVFLVATAITLAVMTVFLVEENFCWLSHLYFKQS